MAEPSLPYSILKQKWRRHRLKNRLGYGQDQYTIEPETPVDKIEVFWREFPQVLAQFFPYIPTSKLLFFVEFRLQICYFLI